MKRMTLSLNVFTLLGVLVWVPGAQAHHAFSTGFVEDLRGTVTGTVSEVFFRNPHVHYYMTVTSDEGKPETWAAVTMNLGVMTRLGWSKDTLKPGDKVTVNGALGRNNTPKIWIQTVETEDGTMYDMGTFGPD